MIESDDTPLVYQDSVISIVASEDGTYVIQVRESAFGGSAECRCPHGPTAGAEPEHPAERGGRPPESRL
jgi:hypothetical protein